MQIAGPFCGGFRRRAAVLADKLAETSEQFLQQNDVTTRRAIFESTKIDEIRTQEGNFPIDENLLLQREANTSRLFALWSFGKADCSSIVAGKQKDGQISLWLQPEFKTEQSACYDVRLRALTGSLALMIHKNAASTYLCGLLPLSDATA